MAELRLVAAPAGEPVDRALVLTDVVDSTALASALGPAANAALWDAHDRSARELLRAHGGTELERTDGLMAVFDDVPAAVRFTLAYHAALRELSPPLTARAGVHHGPVVARANPEPHVRRGAKALEVDGLALSVTARVQSVAGPGGTLLTEAARARLPAEVRTEAHGHWALKGVEDPVALYGVAPPEGPAPTPADGPKAWRVVRDGELWIPARSVPHRLPRERDAFVGREEDLRALAGLLESGASLVTLVGPGGTGKTRVAVRHAWRSLGELPGGAWCCDLSEARSVDGVCHAVASALDVPLGAEDPVSQLGRAIAGRSRCLVVLDTFEGVTAHASATLGRWLDGAREATFVVTSREVTGLPGETALALDPLPSDEAVALFVARARQARRDFEPTAEDRPALAELVRLLDGLPLAIELAASRVRVMPPRVLVERMADRFRLLSSPGGRPGRQATLRATFDWSWELTGASERRALAQLSVFEGGFTLEAAEAVLETGEVWPADAVQGLVDRSWVQAREDRFGLLDSVRAYAAEKLAALGEVEATEIRHGAFFGQAPPDGRESDPREVDNCVAACRRAVARGDGPVAVGALRAAESPLFSRGPLAAAVALAELVAGMPGLDRRERADALVSVGNALGFAGDEQKAGAALAVARAAASEVDDPVVRRRVAFALAGHALRSGRLREAFSEYARLAEACRGTADEGSAIGNLGVTAHRMGRFAEASAFYERALAWAGADASLAGRTLLNLGGLRAGQGAADEAEALYARAFANARSRGDRRLEGTVTAARALGLMRLGRFDEALREHSRALVLAREVGDAQAEARALGGRGSSHVRAGALDAGQQDLTAAFALATACGERRAAALHDFALARVEAHRGRAHQARTRAERAVADLQAVGDTLFAARAALELAHVEAELGRADEAARWIEVALGSGAEGPATERLAAGAAAVRRQLGLPPGPLGDGSTFDGAALRAAVALDAGEPAEALADAAGALAVAAADVVTAALLSARSRVAADRPEAARADVDRAGAEVRRVGFGGALRALHGVVDAEVALAEGRPEAARAALDGLDPVWSAPASEVGRLAARARARLAGA